MLYIHDCMVISEVFTPEDQISFVMRCQGANFMIVRIFSGLQIFIFVLETERIEELGAKTA